MKIWKFPLELADHQKIKAPFNMGPLSVQMQNGVPCLWAIVDPAMGETLHNVWIHGTGHEVDPLVAGHFVGTFQALNGSLVFHVFCIPTK